MTTPRFEIRKAQKGKQKLRLGLVGPTGSGKTLTGLMFAKALVEGTDLRIGVIDSERESSELYADRFDFDVIQLTESHDPRLYIAALDAFAATGRHGVVLVDSLSHAWMGREGTLQQVDEAAARMRTPNSYAAWRDVTPLHNQLVDALLAQPYHMIATLRAKMDYVQEKDDKGKTVIRKVGMAPIQRDGMEYEFTVVCEMDVEHHLIVGKTRCAEVDGKVIHRPDGKFATVLRNWIESGVEKAPRQSPPTPDAPEPTENGNGKAPTKGQLALREQLMKSHVFTDEERAKLNDAMERRHTIAEASKQIDRLQTQLASRMKAERALSREPGEDDE